MPRGRLSYSGILDPKTEEEVAVWDRVRNAPPLQTGNWLGTLLNDVKSAVLPNAGDAPEQTIYKSLQAGMGILGAQGLMGAPALMSGAPVSGVLGVNVYHGSPHKFDRFDASKIGTGEGAQAYGHGLYFAENPKVAEGYAKTISVSKQDPTAIGILHQHGTKDAAIAEINRRAKLDPDFARVAPQKIKAIEALDSANLYKADIPDSMIPKMLDWDKPLSQQSAEVQKALGGFIAKTPEQRLALFLDSEYAKLFPNAADVKAAKGVLRDPDLYGTAAEWAAKQTGTNSAAWNLHRGGDSAAAAYQALSKQLGGDVAASAKLRELGIPGIRYLDQGSRRAGQGTYNYVVFPGMEKEVKILERN